MSSTSLSITSFGDLPAEVSVTINDQNPISFVHLPDDLHIHTDSFLSIEELDTFTRVFYCVLKDNGREILETEDPITHLTFPAIDFIYAEDNPKKKNQALCLVAFHGNEVGVKTLLNKKGITPLTYQVSLLVAAKKGNSEIFQALLKDDRFQNINKSFLKRIFITAVFNGHIEIVKQLIENARFSSIIKSSTFIASIKIAAENGHQEILQAFLQHNLTDKQLSLILFYAARAGHIEIVRAVINHAQFERVSVASAIRAAVEGDQLVVLQELMQLGNARLAEIDTDRLFSLVAEVGSSDLFEELMKYNLFTGNPDLFLRAISVEVFQESFMKACESGNVEILKVLLDFEQFQEVSQRYLNISYKRAFNKGQQAAVDLLSQNLRFEGIELLPTSKDRESENSYVKAAVEGNVEVILQQTDFNLIQQNDFQIWLDMFQAAAENQQVSFIQTMLKNSDQKSFDLYRLSDLSSAAVKSGSLEIVQATLQSSLFQEVDGVSPLVMNLTDLIEEATYNNHEDILWELLRTNAFHSMDLQWQQEIFFFIIENSKNDAFIRSLLLMMHE